jgi:methionine-rich copper-binding protein CopC
MLKTEWGRRSRQVVTWTLMLLMLAPFIAPGAASAHARVASSTPANGATVAPGLTQIEIIFSEEVSVTRSTAQLVNDADGSAVQATMAVDRANRKRMTIGTAPVGAGKYTVKWRVVTEDDNGITNGELKFNVSSSGTSCLDFKETGKQVCGRFAQYWSANGGLAQQGFPISGEMQERSDTDGKTYTVQYFERAVFEYHPETPNTPVLLSLLGNFEFRRKYPNGAPSQKSNTAAGSVLFSETGKRLGGRFLEYWRANGGLAQQGFPISDEFTERSELDGKQYTVQYFERAVFEAHPDNQRPFDVLLSQLGTFRYRQKYP